MDEARAQLAEQEMDRCVIKADRSGLVIYPSNAKWKDAPDIADGATVHMDQVLLLMPDLSKMQVKFGVHESIVDRIKPEMPAKVTIPGRTIGGKVVSVAAAAEPAGWWTGNIVKYDGIAELPSVEGLKPGMSAEVEVTIARQQEVLLIPLEAVIESAQGQFCWVGTPKKAVRRVLELGENNDTHIVVKAGLNEGEQVVLNPSAFFEDAETISQLPIGSSDGIEIDSRFDAR